MTLQALLLSAATPPTTVELLNLKTRHWRMVTQREREQWGDEYTTDEPAKSKKEWSWKEDCAAIGSLMVKEELIVSSVISFGESIIGWSSTNEQEAAEHGMKRQQSYCFFDYTPQFIVWSHSDQTEEKHHQTENYPNHFLFSLETDKNK